MHDPRLDELDISVIWHAEIPQDDAEVEIVNDARGRGGNLTISSYAFAGANEDALRC